MKRAFVFLAMSCLTTVVFSQNAAEALTGQIEARLHPAREVSFVPAAPSNQAPIPFFKTHVVVFFFASTCPYCESQAPVLSRWASTSSTLRQTLFPSVEILKPSPLQMLRYSQWESGSTMPSR